MDLHKRRSSCETKWEKEFQGARQQCTPTTKWELVPPLLEFRGCANDEQRNDIGREPFANAQRFSSRRYNYICMSGNHYRIAISYESKTKVRHRICSAKDFNNARNIPILVSALHPYDMRNTTSNTYSVASNSIRC